MRQMLALRRTKRRTHQLAVADARMNPGKAMRLPHHHRAPLIRKIHLAGDMFAVTLFWDRPDYRCGGVRKRDTERDLARRAAQIGKGGGIAPRDRALLG